MIRLWHKFVRHFSIEFIRDVFGSGVTRLGGMAAGFIFFALIAQQFGAETMGRYAIATTIMGIIGVFCKLGFPTSLVRFISADFSANQPEMIPKRMAWIIKIMSAATIIAALVLLLSREIIARYIFSDLALSPFLLIVALVLLPYNLGAVFTAYHQGAHRISFSSALNNLVVPLFSSVFFVVLVLFSANEIFTILAQAMAICFSCVLGWALYRKHLVPATDRAPLSQEEKKKMLAVSLPLLTGGVSGMLLGWADTLMLGALADTHAAGLYATAFRLSSLISIPLYIIGWAIIPRIAAAYEARNTVLQQKLLSDSVHLALAGASIPFLLFIFFGHYVLSFFGPEFIAAYPVLVVLALSEFIIVYTGNAYSVMMMTNQEKQYQNIMMGAVIFNIVLNYFLIQTMGALGAALATLLTQAGKQLLFTWCIYKGHGLVSFGGFALAHAKRLAAEAPNFFK